MAECDFVNKWVNGLTDTIQAARDYIKDIDNLLSIYFVIYTAFHIVQIVFVYLRFLSTREIDRDTCK